MNESLTTTEDHEEKLPFFPKRKKFLIPIVVLLAAAVFGPVIGVAVAMHVIKSSEAFSETLTELESHEAIKHHVGLPIEHSWWVLSKHEKQAGIYDLTFKITGPNGAAAVRSRCQRVDETEDAPWEVVYLDIGVGGRDGEVITLVGDPDYAPGSP